MTGRAFCLLMLFSFAPVRHPYHVSICDIQHHPESKSLQISLRIFTDDLEETLKKNYAKKIDLSHEDTSNEADSLLMHYLRGHLQISTDDKQKKWKYLGYESRNDGTMIFLESLNTPRLKKIDIDCSVLFDVFEDQSNLVHVKYHNTLKSLRLTASERRGTLSFSESR